MLFSGLANFCPFARKHSLHRGLHTFKFAYNIASINVILSAKYDHILRGAVNNNIFSRKAYAKNISTSVFVCVVCDITTELICIYAYDPGILLIGFARVYTKERIKKE